MTEPATPKFLEKIPLRSEEPLLQLQQRLIPETTYFTWQGAVPVKNVAVETASTRPQNQAKAQEVKSRLTLWIRARIAPLGTDEDATGLSLYADDDRALISASLGEKEEPEPWLHEKAKVIAEVDEPDPAQGDHAPVRLFSTRVLAGLEEAKSSARVLTRGRWDNAIPYDGVPLGRTFAVSTRRTGVLHPNATGNFDPTTDYEYYTNRSPTEQVFLTVYPLLKLTDGRVIDVISRQEVKQDQLLTVLERIDVVGVVKVVLYYVLTERGALQLDTCTIDGLPHTVHRVKE